MKCDPTQYNTIDIAVRTGRLGVWRSTTLVGGGAQIYTGIAQNAGKQAAAAAAMKET